MFDRAILRQAALDSVRKLDPRLMAGNPVMFVVEIGSVLVTAIAIANRADSPGRSPPGSGSRPCLPTWPRRSPKGGARRRRRS